MRFIGKVAVEALAQRLINIEGGQNEIVDLEVLNELRDYVRWNKGNLDWQFHERKIYDESHCFRKDDYQFEVLHEYQFLYTEERELYFILAIWGVEYAINMGNVEIKGYLGWLRKNDNGSPLY